MGQSKDKAIVNTNPTKEQQLFGGLTTPLNFLKISLEINFSSH